jgi:Transglycosylase SLT domain
VLSLAAIGPLRGAELISLANGFQLEADSHRVVGRSVVLEQAGGTIEVEADQVVSIETVGRPAEGDEERRGVQRLDIAPDQDPTQLISKAGIAEGLPANFVLSVAQVESGFQVTAKSAKGAIGLMQLMPQTAAELGVAPDRAEDNAAGGARYLRELLIRYKGNSRLALAAYNAGPGAVDRFRDVPPYLETQQYVDRVLREYARREAASRTATDTTRVAARRTTRTISDPKPDSSNSATSPSISR